jgi:hypothetical protein
MLYSKIGCDKVNLNKLFFIKSSKGEKVEVLWNA